MLDTLKGLGLTDKQAKHTNKLLTLLLSNTGDSVTDLEIQRDRLVFLNFTLKSAYGTNYLFSLEIGSKGKVSLLFYPDYLTTYKGKKWCGFSVL